MVDWHSDPNHLADLAVRRVARLSVTVACHGRDFITVMVPSLNTTAVWTTVRHRPGRSIFSDFPASSASFGPYLMLKQYRGMMILAQDNASWKSLQEDAR